jgi:N-acetylmuramoyl-L-alanine amidase
MPATLLEIGFMDTFKNCQLLMSELWKDLMSSAIANGIENYIKEENNKK